MMATYTIYGDLLFLANFLMDFTLLYGVCRFGNFSASLWRLLWAAVFAAAYGLAAVTPWAAFLNGLGVKLLASLIIVKLAFPRSSPLLYLRALLYFYLLSFAMAGAVMAVSWLFFDGGQQGQGASYTAMALGAAVLLVLLLSRGSMRFVRETLRKNEQIRVIDLMLGDKQVRLNALLDTGNELVEPITGYPVLVAEFHAVAPLLPQAFCDAWLRHPETDVTSLMSDFIHSSIGRRLRLIPFSSIGKRNGLLLGFQPDCVIARGKEDIIIPTSVICLYRGTLHTKDRCRCIMNPAALSEMKDHACSGRPLGLEQ